MEEIFCRAFIAALLNKTFYHDSYCLPGELAASSLRWSKEWQPFLVWRTSRISWNGYSWWVCQAAVSKQYLWLTTGIFRNAACFFKPFCIITIVILNSYIRGVENSLPYACSESELLLSGMIINLQWDTVIVYVKASHFYIVNGHMIVIISVHSRNCRKSWDWWIKSVASFFSLN